MTPAEREVNRAFEFIPRLARYLALKGEVLLDFLFGTLTFRWLRRLPHRDFSVEIFNALRQEDGIWVQGRVLAAKKLRPPHAGDSRWINLRRTLAYWWTHEKPRAHLEVICGDAAYPVSADDQGQFSVRCRPCPADRLIVRLVEDPKVKGEAGQPPKPEIRNLVPGGEATEADILGVEPNSGEGRVLVISDVDDTVLESNAMSLRRLVATNLFGNLYTRRIFPGVGHLYTELRQGPHGTEKNPFYYVTSSPWNLHGFLTSVFEYRGLPLGGFLMTDWGLTEEQWFTPNTHRHKTEAIRNILEWHPGIPVILFGDSGEKDPEIYSDIVREFPERISAVYIRDVIEGRRDEELGELRQAAAELEVEFHIVPDTASAASLLAEHGWLNDEQVSRVTEAMANPAGQNNGAGDS